MTSCSASRCADSFSQPACAGQRGQSETVIGARKSVQDSECPIKNSPPRGGWRYHCSPPFWLGAESAVAVCPARRHQARMVRSGSSGSTSWLILSVGNSCACSSLHTEGVGGWINRRWQREAPCPMVASPAALSWCGTESFIATPFSVPVLLLALAFRGQRARVVNYLIFDGELLVLRAA